MEGVCKLCLEMHELKDSHIYPRSVLKRFKRNSSQAYMLTDKIGVGARKVNYNPTEYMLCTTCEIKLSQKYENYGARFLVNKKSLSRERGGVRIKNMDYDRLYLYFISILWRASVAKSVEFNHISLGEFYNEWAREAVFSGKIKRQTSSGKISLDSIIGVCLFRMTDSKGELGDDILRDFFSPLRFQAGDRSDMFIFTMFVDGFIVVYTFTSYDDFHEMRVNNKYPRLSKYGSNFIKLIDVRELKEFVDVINNTVDSMRENRREG